MEETSPPERYAEPGIYPWGRIVLFILALVLIEIVHGTAEYGFTVGASEMDALVGVILSVYLIWLVHSISLKPAQMVLLIWLNLFVIRFVNNIIEGYYFTDLYTSILDLLIPLAYAAIFSGLTALTTVLVYMDSRPLRKLSENLKETFAKSSVSGWFIRLFIAGPLYFVVYFAFGMVVSPFVYPYYSDPALGLKIPSFAVMIPVEIARGIIYGLVLLPLIASLRFGRLNAFVCVSMMLFIPGALLPLIQAPLPVQIIPYHAVEILGDSLVFGYLLVWLFKFGESRKVMPVNPSKVA